jgi:hypothetical protein
VVLEKELGEAELSKVFKLESDLIPVVVEIERHGFAVDVSLLRKLRDQAEKKRRDRCAKSESRLSGSNPESVRVGRSKGVPTNRHLVAKTLGFNNLFTELRALGCSVERAVSTAHR